MTSFSNAVKLGMMAAYATAYDSSDVFTQIQDLYDEIDFSGVDQDVADIMYYLDGTTNGSQEDKILAQVNSQFDVLRQELFDEVYGLV